MTIKLFQKIQTATSIVFVVAMFFLALISLNTFNTASAQNRCVGGGLAPDGDTANCPEASKQSKCEGSEGDWIVQSESVGGKIVDGSFCRCPDGLSLINNACTDNGTSTSVSLPSDSTGSSASNDAGKKAIETNCEPKNGAELNSSNCGIVGYLVTGINVLSAIAGMAIVFSIMYAGFQYMTARDNPQAISAAKDRIVWAIVALLVFIFMYAGLDFLVPGGVL